MARKKDTGPSPETREIVLNRDSWLCQWCGKHVLMEVFGYSLQHRRARGMGGSSDPDTNSPANLVLMCGSGTTGCHGHVEAHPHEARERGFRVDQYDDPAAVPLVLWNRVSVLLGHDGTRRSW